MLTTVTHAPKQLCVAALLQSFHLLCGVGNAAHRVRDSNVWHRVGAARDPCRWLMSGLRTGNRELLRHVGLCAGCCQGCKVDPAGGSCLESERGTGMFCVVQWCVHGRAKHAQWLTLSIMGTWLGAWRSQVMVHAMPIYSRPCFPPLCMHSNSCVCQCYVRHSACCVGVTSPP